MDVNWFVQSVQLFAAGSQVQREIGHIFEIYVASGAHAREAVIVLHRCITFLRAINIYRYASRWNVCFHFVWDAHRLKPCSGFQLKRAETETDERYSLQRLQTIIL